MFNKKQSPRPTARARQPNRTLTESFRRNTVVISRRQKEVAQRQQSVTQRQIQLKKDTLRRRHRTRAILVLLLLLTGFTLFRLRLTGATVESNASTRLRPELRIEYERNLYALFTEHTVLGQAWLLDTTAMRQEVLAKYPEIEHIEFHNNPLINTHLKADIRFRKPVFTWSDASQNLQFVDDKGVLFTQNLHPGVVTEKLIQIEDQSGTVLDAGTSVLTTNIITFIGQLHAKVLPLYGTKAVISKVIIPQSTREVQLQIKGMPYSIKFNSTRDINEQVGELGTLLNHLKAQNKVPAAYIDLRVPHKVFYK